MASLDFINTDGNVVDNYNWSVSTKFSARDQTPRINIQEFQQNVSSIRQSIEYWAGQVQGLTPGTEVKDPYVGLYAVDRNKPGNYYTFPYYNEYHHAVTNSWGENKGTIGALAATASEAVTKLSRPFFPSAGIEAAKTWEGSGAPAQYQFTFHLLNTVNPEADIKRNKDLIKALLNNNLMDKVDFVAVRPPAICEITIPGIRGTTVGVMSTINIANIGQMNWYGDVEGSIPDAYQITITVQELLTESRQILQGELEGGKVFANVTSDIIGVQSVKDSASEAGAKLGDTVTSMVDKLKQSSPGQGAL